MLIRWIQEKRLQRWEKKRDEAAEEVRKLKYQKAVLEGKVELAKKLKSDKEQ